MNAEKISVVRGSLLDLNVDVIVNAADKKMRGGGGIDAIVHKKGGPALTAELTEKTPCGAETALTVLTKGHGLKQPWVIHVAGPIWYGGKKGEPALLQACYRNSLHTAVEHKFKSIGFCSISTGVYNYPLGDAAPLAIQTVVGFLDKHPDSSLEKIVFAMFKLDEYEAFTKALGACHEL